LHKLQSLAQKINPDNADKAKVQYILVNIYKKGRPINLQMAQVKHAKWNGLSLAFLQIFTLQSKSRRFGHENKESMEYCIF
jgi:hypothetical protein